MNKCKHCKYEWETKSALLYVSCPNCRKTTPNKTKWIMKGSGTAKEVREKGLSGTVKEVEYQVGDGT